MPGWPRSRRVRFRRRRRGHHEQADPPPSARVRRRARPVAGRREGALGRDQRGREGGAPARARGSRRSPPRPASSPAFRPACPPSPAPRSSPRKAATVGFDWPDAAQVVDKIEEELREVARGARRPATRERDRGRDRRSPVRRRQSRPPCRRRSRVGASRRTNAKFERRFGAIEQALAAAGRTLADASLDDMEDLWVKAKRRAERDAPPRLRRSAARPRARGSVEEARLLLRRDADRGEGPALLIGSALQDLGLLVEPVQLDPSAGSRIDDDRTAGRRQGAARSVARRVSDPLARSGPRPGPAGCSSPARRDGREARSLVGREQVGLVPDLDDAALVARGRCRARAGLA